MKEYCTQNKGRCRTCNLVNYGLDCANQPIDTTPPSETKYTRMLQAYSGHHGPVTIQAVLDQIPPELKTKLTGRQLGLVMSAVNTAYHNGKAACQAEVIDGDAIWINRLNRLFELNDIATIPVKGHSGV